MFLIDKITVNPRPFPLGKDEIGQTMTDKKRRTQKTVRNLRNLTVHLRLQGRENEKPFRAELRPRGQQGDWVTVPSACTSDPSFEKFVSLGLIEIIPLKEAREIHYARANRPEGPRVVVMDDRVNSRVVGKLKPNTTDMERVRPTIANVEVDKEGADLIEKGVMPPLPKVRKK